MKGAELILRYFAFRDNRNEYAKPLSSFLDQYSTRSRSLLGPEVKSMADDFLALIERIDFCLGKLAFRIFDEEHRATSPFNSALYDAEMIGFRETTNPKIVGRVFSRPTLLKHVARLFKNDKFMASIRQATSDELAVKNRIEMFQEHLDRF